MPRHGRHQGGRLDEAPTSNVRAHAPAVTPRSPRPRILHQVLYDAEFDRYQIRSGPPWRLASIEPGFEERARSIAFGTIARQLPERHRFIVFENPLTADVAFDPAAGLTENWYAGGRFDRGTTFVDEREAEAYAEERKKEFTRQP